MVSYPFSKTAIILLFAVLFAALSLAYGSVSFFVDTADTDFDAGILLNITLDGSGDGANLTLNRSGPRFIGATPVALQGGTAANVNDNDYTTVLTTDAAPLSGAAIALLDLGKPGLVSKAEALGTGQTATAASVSFRFEYSHDNTSWTTFGSGWTVNPGNEGYNHTENGSAHARYWRIAAAEDFDDPAEIASFNLYVNNTYGNFTSQVFDAGGAVEWENLSWVADVPADTNLTLYYRNSSDNIVYSGWAQVGPPPAELDANTQYVQYLASFNTSNASLTPVLENVTLSYSSLERFRINSNVTDPAAPIESDEVTIIVNATSPEPIQWVNFTIIAPNGSTIVDNLNASSHSGDIWNSTPFNATDVGTWGWNITAYDGFSTVNTSGSFLIPAWHVVFGNVTGRLALQDESGSSLLNWNVIETSGSNVYVTDSDSSITFSALKALSRTTADAYTGEDFEEADSILGMTNLTDSINSSYTEGGDPVGIRQFTIFGVDLANVPIINSSNTSLLSTGILWDTDDDIGGDGSFDETDKEDLVFVTQTNSSTQGQYGVYDYEIRIPAKLRSYQEGIDTVSLYAEIR